MAPISIHVRFSPGFPPELVYTIVNPIASLSDLRNRYSPSDYLLDFRPIGFIGEFGLRGRISQRGIFSTVALITAGAPKNPRKNALWETLL
jgi:hypothetical protein